MKCSEIHYRIINNHTLGSTVIRGFLVSVSPKICFLPSTNNKTSSISIKTMLSCSGGSIHIEIYRNGTPGNMQCTCVALKRDAAHTLLFTCSAARLLHLTTPKQQINSSSSYILPTNSGTP